MEKKVLVYEDVERITDPYERGAAIREYLARLAQAQATARLLRDQTILELLKTESRADVCALLGVGMSHVRSLQLLTRDRP